MPWKKLLVWATGQIDEALRQKLEFVLEENRVYRALLERHSPHWRLQEAERNHQGLNNVIPFPDQRTGGQDGTIRKSERLGGLLNFYHRAA